MLHLIVDEQDEFVRQATQLKEKTTVKMTEAAAVSKTKAMFILLHVQFTLPNVNGIFIQTNEYKVTAYVSCTVFALRVISLRFYLK